MNNKYVAHYLDWKNATWFLIVAFFGLLIVLGLIFLDARRMTDKNDSGSDNPDYSAKPLPGKKKTKMINLETCQVVERFYELVFSSTSILFFLAAYYLIDRFMKIREYRIFWNR